MRIGVITTSYPRYPGEPAGTFVAELTDWLLDCGHEVEVIAAGCGDHSDDWHRASVVRLPAESNLFYCGGAPDALQGEGVLSAFRAKIAAAKFSARLVAAVGMRARRYDGMVAHWLAPCALAAVMVAPRLPIWAIAHGGDVHALARSRLLHISARLFDRPNVHLNFVSHESKSVFFSKSVLSISGRDAMRDRAQVFPMGIDLARFTRIAKKRSDTVHSVSAPTVHSVSAPTVRSDTVHSVSAPTVHSVSAPTVRSDSAPNTLHSGTALKPGRSEPGRLKSQQRNGAIVLFLGRLIELKGVDLLIDAIAGLPHKVQLVIAGSGPVEQQLKKQAAALGLTIDWRGEVGTEYRDKLLEEADVVVIPSREFRGRREGMPLVALEALAVGAQVLVSDSGGLSEIPESICHRFPAEDVAALRHTLAAILAGDMAPYAPGHWLEERSWNALGPKILPGLTPLH